MIFILKKFFTPFLILSLFLIMPSYGSVSPDKLEYQGSELIKNGQGTRIIFFMEVYEGSLYLETKNSNAKEIVNKNTPMAIRLDVISSLVTADAMKHALNEGLKKSTGNNTNSINNEIIQLSTSFNSSVNPGDYYEFIYLPEIGTHFMKNSELVELIQGLDFKKAFFGIFLSNNPIQNNLKKAMLGG
jgi:hypothetical protein